MKILVIIEDKMEELKTREKHVWNCIEDYYK